MLYFEVMSGKIYPMLFSFRKMRYPITQKKNTAESIEPFSSYDYSYVHMCNSFLFMYFYFMFFKKSQADRNPIFLLWHW